MKYSLEPHYRRYVQAQGFMSFARNIGNKYGKSIINSKNAKKYLMLANLCKINMVKKY